MAHFSLLRLPRPKAFLYVMSLRTGTELITTTLIINKLTGLYGLLALLTGLHLSPLQLSMYIYSIFALALAAYLAPHIRKQTPLHCLALAWFYVLDSVINAAYTAAFGMAWFVVTTGHPGPAPGGKTMKDTGGFSDPVHNVDSVEVHADGLHASNSTLVRRGVPAGSLGQTLVQSGSMASISVIMALWIVRVYFMLVVMSYARVVLRQHIVMSSWQPSGQYPAGVNEKGGLAENPFAEGKEEGAGWKGKLGRVMVGCGKKYWLGVDEDPAWTQSMGIRLGRTEGVPGTVERERRRRTGTGPPAVPAQLKTEARKMQE